MDADGRAVDPRVGAEVAETDERGLGDQRVGPGQSCGVQLRDGSDFVGVWDGHQVVDGPSVGIAEFRPHPVARRVLVRQVLARRQMFETEKRIPMAGPASAGVVLDNFNFPKGESVRALTATLLPGTSVDADAFQSAGAGRTRAVRR